MIIYRIKNLQNGKVYIGQTKRPLKERLAEHLKQSSNSVVGKDMKNLGLANFLVDIIEECTDQEELDKAEKKWIAMEDCVEPNGYNQCQGGLLNTTGYHHKEEAKAAMRKAKQYSYLGNSNPFYGKHHSNEQRERWSQLRKGMGHVSEAGLKNIRASHFTAKVRCVETGEVFNSITEAATKYGITPTHISRVCRGKRKRTGGYHWEYIK